jgi:ATP-dependent DNA helicase RecG
VLVSERYPLDNENPPDDEAATVKARLDALRSTSDGFLLAEMDLEQRREGELLGLSQSGLPPLRVASLSRKTDQQMSLRARQLAEKIVDANGGIDPAYDDLKREVTTGWLWRVGAGEVIGGEESADG